MSETIGEIVLPGTYIDVRAEGLIGVGTIASGNVGVVGTANKGPVGEVQIIGSYGQAVDAFGLPDAWPDDPASDHPLSLTRSIQHLLQGGASSIFAVRVAKVAEDAELPSTTWEVLSATSDPLFTLTAKSPGTWADAMTASITKPTGGDPTLTLTLGRRKETFSGADAAALAKAIASSQLVDASAPDEDDGGIAAASVDDPTLAATDGADVTSAEIATGLDALALWPVNIVAVGGLTAGDSGLSAAVLAHLEATENDGRERIAVIGVGDASPQAIASDNARPSNPRVVVVTPGIRAIDNGRMVNLPASYAAALVAGRIASVAPHVSLTNKDVAAADLNRDYTRAEQKLLLQNNLLVLAKNLGIRVLKGISTDTGAFRQISVRRVVDRAKAGVRLGSNPYIGRLNNDRVRAALKATLDGFLSSMVLDEMLTGYKLEVSATRAEEIRGECIVTMTLLPTFSIDYIKVIMNLA